MKQFRVFSLICILVLIAAVAGESRVLYAKAATLKQVHEGNIIDAPRIPCKGGMLRDRRNRCRKMVKRAP